MRLSTVNEMLDARARGERLVHFELHTVYDCVRNRPRVDVVLSLAGRNEPAPRLLLRCRNVQKLKIQFPYYWLSVDELQTHLKHFAM